MRDFWPLSSRVRASDDLAMPQSRVENMRESGASGRGHLLYPRYDSNRALVTPIGEGNQGSAS